MYMHVVLLLLLAIWHRVPVCPHFSHVYKTMIISFGVFSHIHNKFTTWNSFTCMYVMLFLIIITITFVVSGKISSRKNHDIEYTFCDGHVILSRIECAYVCIIMCECY